MRKPNPQYPKRRGDIGDFGDIFRKPSNHAGSRVFEFGDILGMSPRDGDGRRGCVAFLRAFPCAQRCGRKAHLVTICHRLREWPFFRVFGAQRRIDGFPFGWRRNPPKRAVFWPYRMAHRIDRRSTHTQGYLARGNPGFRREARSTRGHKFRIILSWPQRRLFPRF